MEESKIISLHYCFVMKRELILIRHTKSGWSDFSLPDYERPLKKDRIEDAINMAKGLKEITVKPDLIICSPAVRTTETARFFCHQLSYPFKKIVFDKRIYEAGIEDVLQVIRETPAEVKQLLLIGHNPALTYLAALFSGNAIQHLPTTGVAWFEFESDDWEIYTTTPCQLKAFLSPKTI